MSCPRQPLPRGLGCEDHRKGGVHRTVLLLLLLLLLLLIIMITTIIMIIVIVLVIVMIQVIGCEDHWKGGVHRTLYIPGWVYAHTVGADNQAVRNTTSCKTCFASVIIRTYLCHMPFGMMPNILSLGSFI